MIDGLRPYPAYKDSGVPWLGEVPEHWEATSLRRKLRLYDGIKIGPFGSQLKLEHMSESGFKVYGQANVIARDFARGSKFIDQTKFDELSACEVRGGDVVVTMMGTSGRCARVPEDAVRGIMDSHLIRLRTTPEVARTFAARLIDEAAYIKQQIAIAGKGSIMHGLNSSMIKDLLVALPPLLEQSAIVRFLDHADRRIRRYIRAKQKLIQLLEEQKQAIIHRAVTRGLDPNVRLKPSGVEWLGEVPEHWEVTTVRRLITFITSGSRGWAEHYADEGDLFIQSGNLGRSLALDLGHVQRVRVPLGAEGRRTQVVKHDVLICITGALTGNVAFVDEVLPPAYVNQHVALVRPDPRSVVPRFLAYALHSRYAQDQFRLTEYGGTKQGLGLDDIRDVLVLLPGTVEQERIVTALDIETARSRESISMVDREISLLREYRTRLIADVVTGKLDVREAAARLPNEEEPEAMEEVEEAEDGLDDEGGDPDTLLDEGGA